MELQYDKSGKLRIPEVILSNADQKKQFGSLSGFIQNYRIKVMYNNLAELTFNYPSKYLNKNGWIETPNYNKIESKRYIYINDNNDFGGWYIITEVTQTIDSSGVEKKIIKCYSAGCEFGNKKIYPISGTFKLYDPIAPSDTLMGQILSFMPSWSIGNVDNTLLGLYRTLDIKDQDLYSLLTSTISEAFKCVFIFDNINYIINIIDSNKIFETTDAYLDGFNLIKTDNIKTLTTQIKTAVKVSGSDGVYINNINPAGSDVIYDFSYYRQKNSNNVGEYMSNDLLLALDNYDVKFTNSKSQFSLLQTNLKTFNDELDLLNNNPPEYNITSTNNIITINPSLSIVSGLNELNAVLASLDSIKQARITAGNIGFNDISVQETNVNNLISQKNAQIINKQSQIDTTTRQLQNISNSLNFKNNFTHDEWLELDRFIYMDTIQDNTFAINDEMSQSEKQQVSQDLYNSAIISLAKISQPRYSISTECINFLALEKFKVLSKRIGLGKTLTIKINKNTTITPILLGIDMGFDEKEITNFTLHYGNRNGFDDAYSVFKAFQQSYNTGVSYSYNMQSIEDMKSQQNDVSNFINGSLDLFKNSIISSQNQKVTIDTLGIRVNDGNSNGLWLGSNYIGFTDDNWTSCRLGIGKIPSPNGNGYVYGIVGDEIVGKILAGNVLHINSTTGQFTVDQKGCRLDNASFTLTTTKNGHTNVISLDPSVGIRITKDNSSQFYIDTNGDLTMSGLLTASKIKGTSIDSSTITATEINGGIIRGTEFIGGSVNIGDNKFTVDNGGNVNCESLVARNPQITSDSGNFTLSKQGQMKTVGGSIINGFIELHSGNNDIYLDPNVGIKITNNGNPQMFIDTNGNVIFKGTIGAGSIISPDVYVNKLASEVNSNNYLTLGSGQFADLTWYSNNINLFQIYDNIGSIDLRVYGQTFLTSGQYGNYMLGKWVYKSYEVATVNDVRYVENTINGMQYQIYSLQKRVSALEQANAPPPTV